MRRAKPFPPVRLAPLTEAQLRWVRPLWFLALAFAVVWVIAGTVFVVRDAYYNDIQYGRLALASEVQNDGTVTVGSMDPGPTGIEPGSRITAIDGKPVPANIRVWTLATRLQARDGQVVTLSVVAPDGRATQHRIAASSRHLIEDPNVPVGRDTRFAARIVSSMLTCITLIACAVLLFLRRPHDPVALLFSFAFLAFAATVDPPLLLWVALGVGTGYDIYSSIGWLLLVLGIAAFPDGRFNPRPVRYVLLAAPLLSIPLMFDEAPILLVGTIAFVLPLLLLICNAIKYRRFPPGSVERQQVKWAAFGFASGLIMLTAVVIIFVFTNPETGPYPAVWSLVITLLFSLGFMAMALGLLISLTRFRLWEADRVISRSAISAAVTLAVGIVWTLSMDMLKVGVEWVLGEENETVATMAGALLAAGIFAPTQALAMRWAKTRIAGDESRIERLKERLLVWRTTERPEEIGIRTLSALHAAVHCSCAALLIDGPRGLSLLAARDVEEAEALSAPGYDPGKDRRFVMQLQLEDEDGPMGLLLVGPRSDMNRYNAAQLDGLASLTEPLAEALRAAIKRTQQVEGLHHKLGTVEERLARLEQGGGPKLSPT